MFITQYLGDYWIGQIQMETLEALVNAIAML